MNGYNGFTAAERNAFHRWQCAEIAAGRIVPATCCAACGQTRGIIDHHAEDYSKPWSAEKNVPEGFNLCFICHMMLHSRFSRPKAWERYVKMIQDGAQYSAQTARNMGLIRSLCGPNWQTVDFQYVQLERAENPFGHMNLRVNREA